MRSMMARIEPGEDSRSLKVGQLAKRTGLTVRTLHHWHDVGLLVPSERSASGHRLYRRNDLLRLQQIVSLRQLGFPLEEIRELLDEHAALPLRIIESHLARVRQRMATQRELVRRLETVASELRSVGTVSAEDLLLAVEATRMYEKYFTPEQMDRIRARREIVGEERIREVEAEWPRLIAEVRAEMDKGTDPAAESVQALARRWQGLIDEFTGASPEIEQGVARVWQGEPGLAEKHDLGGLDAAMFTYMGKALAAMRTQRE